MSPSAVRKWAKQFRYNTTNSLTLWRTTRRPKMLLEEHRDGIDTFLCHAVSCAAAQKNKVHTKLEPYVTVQLFSISSLVFHIKMFSCEMHAKADSD